MTYSVKSFNLAWGAVTAPAGGGSVTYRVFEDPDGAGPAAGAQIAGPLAGATHTHMVTGLLHTRLNAQYTVQACNSGGCSSPTVAVTPNITQAIGYFKANNTKASDNYGYAVALSADGSTLAVGAPSEDSGATGIGGDQTDVSMPNAGAVYVFIRSAGVWSQQAYVKASNTDADDQFGSSVALSADGNTLAVSAPGEDSNATGINGDQTDDSAFTAGAVYVFTRSAGVWSQQAYVKASNTGANDYFGYRLALSGDGNTLAVGAIGEGSNATGINGDEANNSKATSGAVYVFIRSAGAWSQQAYVKASNTGVGDQFGTSVALSANGNTLAVGAYSESSNATGINGDQANDSTGTSGAVYVFTRSAGAWSQQAYIKASNTQGTDYFGRSVGLSGDGNTLAVGADGEDSNASGINGNLMDNSASGAGAVYVY